MSIYNTGETFSLGSDMMQDTQRDSELRSGFPASRELKPVPTRDGLPIGHIAFHADVVADAMEAAHRPESDTLVQQ
jgi:hypothetical protein